jgi:hypothetical protein
LIAGEAKSRVLRVWLVIMALSALNALRIVLSEWSAFVAAFPGTNSAMGRPLAVSLPILLLAALAGVWFWRRWALWLLAAVVMATLAFDIATDGPMMHLAAAIFSGLISAGLLWWNRGRFSAASTVSGDAPAPR